MKTKPRYLLITLAAFIFLAFATLLLANAFDEVLLPEVTTILSEQAPVTKNGTRAFYFLLGLRANKGDPEAEGEASWKQD